MLSSWVVDGLLLVGLVNNIGYVLLVVSNDNYSSVYVGEWLVSRNWEFQIQQVLNDMIGVVCVCCCCVTMARSVDIHSVNNRGYTQVHEQSYDNRKID